MRAAIRTLIAALVCMEWAAPAAGDPAPAGYERIIVDGKVLLVEVATQIIHDVLVDVIFD